MHASGEQQLDAIEIIGGLRRRSYVLVNFDNLENARRKVVATLQLGFLILKTLFEQLVLFFELRLRRGQGRIELGVGQLQLEEYRSGLWSPGPGWSSIPFRTTVSRERTPSSTCR